MRAAFSIKSCDQDICKKYPKILSSLKFLETSFLKPVKIQKIVNAMIGSKITENVSPTTDQNTETQSQNAVIGSKISRNFFPKTSHNTKNIAIKRND